MLFAGATLFGLFDFGVEIDLFRQEGVIRPFCFGRTEIEAHIAIAARARWPAAQGDVFAPVADDLDVAVACRLEALPGLLGAGPGFGPRGPRFRP